MSRRLARAGRLGQRSTGQGRPWSPAAIPDLEGWWSADDALASIGPDVAARPGDSIRSVPDRSRHKRSMGQTTANRQPMLGYLRPPRGNYIQNSDSFKQGDWATPTELLDPLGNKVTEVSADYELGTRQVWRFNTGLPHDLPAADRSITLWVWARTKNPGPQPIWLQSQWNTARQIIEGTDWQLLSYDSSMHSNDTRVNVGFDNNELTEKITDNVYIGTIYATHQTWSDEFVPTTSNRVIPDTSELQRALVFDGVVGNMLTTSPNALGNAPDVTVVAVHGIQASSLTGISGYLLSGSGRADGSNVASVRDTGVRRFTRWRQYDVTTDISIEPRRGYLDIMYQQPDGRVVFRNGGQQYSSVGQSPPDPYSIIPYGMGAEGLAHPNTYANGPITDVLYYTRALSDEEIQRVEDYFLIKSGINRIVTEESEVKELETVKALAPGIWYLDGDPLNEEPLQEIMVPFGSAGKELTVGDSYGIEVLP